MNFHNGGKMNPFKSMIYVQLNWSHLYLIHSRESTSREVKHVEQITRHGVKNTLMVRFVGSPVMYLAVHTVTISQPSLSVPLSFTHCYYESISFHRFRVFRVSLACAGRSSVCVPVTFWGVAREESMWLAHDVSHTADVIIWSFAILHSLKVPREVDILRRMDL